MRFTEETKKTWTRMFKNARHTFRRLHNEAEKVRPFQEELRKDISKSANSGSNQKKTQFKLSYVKST